MGKLSRPKPRKHAKIEVPEQEYFPLLLGTVAWVAIEGKIIFDFVYLCPSAASCVRERLVRPTTRELQELHVVPDVPHDV